MTTLVLAALAFLFATAIYLGALVGRRSAPGDFIDAGGALPPWVVMFAGAGVVVGVLSLHDHFLLAALYGLPYSHIAIGLTLAALAGAMAHKRLWLASRLTGWRSPIEVLSAYYGSVSLRLALVGLALIFAAPFAAQSLGAAGDLVGATTGGLLSRQQAIFVTAMFLFIAAALGGWRAVAFTVAAQSFLALVLVAFTALILASGFDALAIVKNGPSAMKAVLADQIPGVMQYSAGLGKDQAAGGPWTTLAIASTGASLIGATLSPAFGYLVTTARMRSGLAFQQVWMIAGLAAGLLLIVAPIVGAEIAAADADGFAAGAPHYAPFIDRLARLDAFAALSFLVLLMASLQLTASFFVCAAANLVAADIVHRYVLPDLSGHGRRLAARIVMACLFAAAALIAAFAPVGAAILGSVALSLSAQLLPAYIGLGFAPWISRSGVLVGLIVGGLIVLFTEPPGLIAFEGLFLDLPWGRWPLTVHSTVWGLSFNVAACLLVSLFTRAGVERTHRDILHAAFREALPRANGGSSLRAAKWSLTLIWTFLALGPGAILGNSFFSKPMFVEGDAALGLPSLWVWQIVAWLSGVLLVWWLAYRGRMAIVEAAVLRPIDRGPPVELLTRRRAPQWIALLLARVAQR